MNLEIYSGGNRDDFGMEEVEATEQAPEAELVQFEDQVIAISNAFPSVQQEKATNQSNKAHRAKPKEIIARFNQTPDLLRTLRIKRAQV